ncbi:MAG: peptidoglycan editing factor PgeF [Coxiellaceae bacterium]|nr:peptidoglycan editing factor PgeF [Coxiellaceae bacterium]
MKRRTYLTPNWPAPKNIRAYTSTRLNGFSTAPFDSFNLGDYVNDDPYCVNQNKTALIDDLTLPEAPLFLNQVHGDCAVRIEEHTTAPEADASFTTKKNKVCAVLTADCLPVLLCNREGTEVAAIHAGWKGLLVNVIEATIKSMQSSPDDLIAWMGPGLGPDHFEMGNEVYADFLNTNPDYANAFKRDGKRWLFNAYTIGDLQLKHAGINAIYGGDFCTFKDKERFYSYRRDKGVTGRMTSLIYIT